MGFIADLQLIGSKVKAGFLKAVSEVDGVVLPEAEKLQPLLDAVSEATVPGSSTYVNMAVKWLEDSVAVMDAGGAAVEAKFTDAGLDTAAIASVKGLIPAYKAAAKK
jgi:hypothetical protein